MIKALDLLNFRFPRDKLSISATFVNAHEPCGQGEGKDTKNTAGMCHFKNWLKPEDLKYLYLEFFSFLFFFKKRFF